MANELDGFFGKVKGQSTPKGPRRTAKVYEASVPTFDAVDIEASMQRAMAEFDKAAETLTRRETKRHNQAVQRRQTKTQLTEKVRGEIAAGKLPKGSLTKTVTRRWKSTQGRWNKSDQKFSASLQEKLDALKEQYFPDGAPAEKYQVMQEKVKFTVEATVGISDDVRIISTSFEANSGDDLEALAFLAAADYFQDDRIDLEDFSITREGQA